MATEQTFRPANLLPPKESDCLTSHLRLPSESAFQSSKILVADPCSSSRSEIRAALDGIGHDVIEVENATDAISSIPLHKVELALVSQDLPASGGAEFCRLVKEAAATQFLPIFVMAPRWDVEGEVIAMDAGADEFIAGPLCPQALSARIRARLRHKAMIDSLDESETVLFSLAQSVEDRDSALAEHCERLVLVTSALGMRLGLPKRDLLTLERASYLHDIGKVGIPDSVLFKPGPLTEEEWEIMKSHAERGERICSNIRSLAPVLPLIRHHHEKWDGTGYPDGLKGEETPLLARVLQMADIYDALTTARPYKRAVSPDRAYEILRSETAKGWRDPKLMDVFADVLPLFRGSSLPDLAKASLQALSVSIEQMRKSPTRNLPSDLILRTPNG